MIAKNPLSSPGRKLLTHTLSLRSNSFSTKHSVYALPDSLCVSLSFVSSDDFRWKRETLPCQLFDRQAGGKRRQHFWLTILVSFQLRRRDESGAKMQHHVKQRTAVPHLLIRLRATKLLVEHSGHSTCGVRKIEDLHAYARNRDDGCRSLWTGSRDQIRADPHVLLVSCFSHPVFLFDVTINLRQKGTREAWGRIMLRFGKWKCFD